MTDPDEHLTLQITPAGTEMMRKLLADPAERALAEQLVAQIGNPDSLLAHLLRETDPQKPSEP